MGNQSGKGTQVAIIKDSNYQVFDKKDFNKFFQDPDHIMCSQYEDFDQFIEKQSLKNLHHIIIIEEHKQYVEKYSKIQEQNKQLVQYMRPIDNLISGRYQTQTRTRDKVINYIKKYSLENINLYIYVKEFNNFIIPEYQVPYVTLVSTTSQIIINHIINQATQKMTSVKFKGLVKDLYRKKLVAVISKYWTEKGKNKKSNNKLSQGLENQQTKLKQARMMQIIKRMEENFKSPENNFQYLIVSSIEQLSDKLKSMYFEFMICIDNEELLQIIEFKKKMPIQSKLIYYGNMNDLGGQDPQDNNIDKVIVDKKKKQIWWISNDLQNEISPVMKKWWNAKTQSSTNSKIAKNVVVLVTKCQNIIQKAYIKSQLQQKIQAKGIANSSAISINIEHKIQNIFKRLRNDLYTIVIVFDSSNEEFQETKGLIMSKIKGQPRLQLSLVEMKKQQNDDKKSYKQMLNKKIQECSSKKYFQFKQQVSPIQVINCLNLTPEEHDYFSYKMGLDVKVLQPLNFNQSSSEQKYKILHKVLQNYFPKIVSKKSANISKISNYEQGNSEQLQFELRSTFENFYIVCSFDDYLKYLFPYLVLAHFYDKKQHTFQMPSKQHLQQIMNYLNRIKVIIYCQVQYDSESQKKINLRQMLKIHQSSAQAQKFIKKTIYEFLEIPLNGEKSNETTTTKIPIENKKDKSQISSIKNLDEETKEQNIESSLKILFNHIFSITSKPLFAKDTNQPIMTIHNEIKPQISFPNIQFVHFKLSQIESYLKLCKYNQLSFSFFPKGSLKEFHQANNEIQHIIGSKSFVIDVSFGSNSEQLKKIFQKNIQVASTHRIQLFKTSKIIQEKKVENFIQKYSGMWKLPFQVMSKHPLRPQYWQLNQQALQQLKEGIIRAFKRSKTYELLKVSPSDFKTFYIDRIQSCKNLLDLQIAVIYIYSLPHGMSDIVAAIFQQNSRSSLSLEIFIEFLFVLFLNFFSFHSRKLQKVETVIYADETQIKDFYEFIKNDDIIFNKNMLHLMDNENVTENQKNHCIVIQYQNVPYMKQSSLSALLKVEELSFYKESAEYLLAPFTKLRLRNKQILSGKYRMYFQVVHHNESNLFLKSFFQLNNINDIGIFQALDENSYKEQIRKLQKDGQELEQNDTTLTRENNKQQANQTKGTNKKRKNKVNNNQNQRQQQKQKQFTSLYRRAQQIGLSEQKISVQFSIRLNIHFMKMLASINKNNLFTAEKYLQLLYSTSENQRNTNDGKKQKRFEEIQQVTQLKKLSIYQAMIYARRHQFNKAINQLDMLLEFMRLQKTQDEDNWIKIKILQLRQQIVRIRNQRHQLIYSIEKNSLRQNHQSKIYDKQESIINNKQLQPFDKQKEIFTNKKQKQTNKPTQSQKWKVNFNIIHQTFIMKRENKNEDEQQIKNENKQQQVYDIYCRHIFEKFDQRTSTQLYVPLTYQLISTFNAKGIEGQKRIDNSTISNKDSLNNNNIQKTQLIKQQQIYDKLLRDGVNSSTIERFFKQMTSQQFHTIKLLHVFITFRNILIYSNNNQQQSYSSKKIEITQKFSKAHSYLLLQKFIQIVVTKYSQFQKQSDDKQQKKIRQNGFIYYLNQQLTKINLLKIRQQLIQQQSLYQIDNHTNNQQQSNFKKNTLSWIDKQIINNNPNNSNAKWSAFQFQNKLILVDNNRKWKQKIQTKHQNNKIFNRTQNEIIQNQKMKKQLSKQLLNQKSHNNED